MAPRDVLLQHQAPFPAQLGPTELPVHQNSRGGPQRDDEPGAATGRPPAAAMASGEGEPPRAAEGGPGAAAADTFKAGLQRCFDDLATGDGLAAAEDWGRAATALSAGLRGQSVLRPRDAKERDVVARLGVQFRVGRADIKTALALSLKTRPAGESERGAVNGQDPALLAAAALDDLDHVLAASGDGSPVHGITDPPEKDVSGRVWTLKGKAHHLLEQYELAESSYLRATALVPGAPGLAESLRKVQAINKEARRGKGGARVLGKELGEEFECVLCLRLFLEPVTTPCGHSFCRGCLQRHLDHSPQSRCPFCRAVIHGGDFSVSHTLKNIITAHFPKEYEEREAQEQEEAGGRAAAESHVPLFVMSTVLLGETIDLNIFEPRYRLMIRRCLEGQGTFGMVGHDGHAPLDIGVETTIRLAEKQPDGRYYISATATRRFEILSADEIDGYRVGKVRYLEDEPPTESEKEEVARLAASIKAKTDAVLQKLNAAPAGFASRIQDFIERAGSQPDPSNVEAYSFWASCLLVTGEGARREALEMTNTLQRLRLVDEKLAHEARCCVM